MKPQCESGMPPHPYLPEPTTHSNFCDQKNPNNGVIHIFLFIFIFINLFIDLYVYLYTLHGSFGPQKDSRPQKSLAELHLQDHREGHPKA